MARDDEASPDWVARRITVKRSRVSSPDEQKKGSYLYETNEVKTSRYTWWNFLPKNLIEQFSIRSNIYFFLIGILQVIPSISTTAGIPTQYMPLAFIIFVSGLRAATEDFGKHAADRRRNASKYEILRGDDFHTVKSGELRVGDIVKVRQDKMIPCDMLFLQSSLPQGHCFVDKANLNGETKLEVMTSLSQTRDVHIEDLEISVFYEEPNGLFDSFRGQIKVGGSNETVTVEKTSLLMRETTLRNCDYIYGLALYCGNSTKIRVANTASSKPKLKQSAIMGSVERYLVANLMFQVILCLLAAVWCGVWLTLNQNVWYLRWGSDNIILASVSVFFSWFILLSQMVPISLTVTAEMVKFAQSQFIQWDIDLYDESIDQRAKCNTSTIHEDLGLINYIFSDKTGTLTQNKMEFRYALLPNGEFGSKETEIAKSVKARKREMQGYSNEEEHDDDGQPSLQQIERDSVNLDSDKPLASTTSSNLSIDGSPDYKRALLPNEHYGSQKSPRIRTVESPQARDKGKSPRPRSVESPRSDDGHERELKLPLHEDIDAEEQFPPSKKRWTELEAPYRSRGKSEPLTMCGGCCAPGGCCSPNGCCVCFLRRCWNRRVDVEKDHEVPEPAEANQFTKDEKAELLKALWGSEGGSEEERKQLRTFMTNMALSNTVRPYDDEGELKYQAESAEESAMVEFARKCGFCKLSQNPTVLEITEGEGKSGKKTKEKYNHVGTLGFTSKRARVTVFYECVEGPLEGKLVAMSKGQDTVMLPLLHELDDKQESELLHNLQVCSANGLRTLLCAQGVQSMDWWKQRKDQYHEAVNNSGDPAQKEKIHKFYEKLEKEVQLEYVGCMGLEDQLQHLVPEAISDFLDANIKVWMITGDKLDAAKNIGIACNLIDPDMQPAFDPQDDISTCIEKFSHARLIEVTGQWAGVADDEEELEKLFYSLDTGKTGRINTSELKTCLDTLKLPLNEEDVMDLFQANQQDIDLPTFIDFMQSTKMSTYEAVKADVEDGLARYKEIKDHELHPISTIVNRDAFLIMFPPPGAKHHHHTDQCKDDEKHGDKPKQQRERGDSDRRDSRDRSRDPGRRDVDARRSRRGSSEEIEETRVTKATSSRERDDECVIVLRPSGGDVHEVNTNVVVGPSRHTGLQDTFATTQQKEDKPVQIHISESPRNNEEVPQRRRSQSNEPTKKQSGQVETRERTKSLERNKNNHNNNDNNSNNDNNNNNKEKSGKEKGMADSDSSSSSSSPNNGQSNSPETTPQHTSEDKAEGTNTTRSDSEENKKKSPKEGGEGEEGETEKTKKPKGEEGEDKGGKEGRKKARLFSRKDRKRSKSEEDNMPHTTPQEDREEKEKKKRQVHGAEGGENEEGEEGAKKEEASSSREERSNNSNDDRESEDRLRKASANGSESPRKPSPNSRNLLKENEAERVKNEEEVVEEEEEGDSSGSEQEELSPTKEAEGKNEKVGDEKKDDKRERLKNAFSRSRKRRHKRDAATEEKLEILRAKFFRLCSVSKSVVFARAEPAMKKLMVTEVQKRLPKVVTLAIGDGANDTDMIMGAHVGVGIAGVEGSAASNSSDYAIGSFRMLHTLIFVHGLWNYHRVANLVYIIFFKSLLVAFAGYCFGFFSAFSGQQVFNEWSTIPYSVMYTALPIIALSVLDKPLGRRTLQNHPSLYASYRGTAFTSLQFFAWVGRAAVYGAICFFVPLLGLTGARARTTDMYWMSTLILYLLVFVPTQIIVFEMANVTFLHFCSLIFSYFTLLLLTFCFSYSIIWNPEMLHIVPKLWEDGEAWFVVIFGMALPIVLELAVRSSYVFNTPTPLQVMREKEHVKKPSVTSVTRDSTVVNLLAEEQNRHHGKRPASPLVRQESKPGEDPEQLRKMIVRSMLRFRTLTADQFETSSHDRYQKHDLPGERREGPATDEKPGKQADPASLSTRTTSSSSKHSRQAEPFPAKNSQPRR